MDFVAQEIGNNLKRYRNRKGYTQEQLAEELMVSVGYISQIENGLKVPSVSMIAKISEALNLTGSMILSDTSNICAELKDIVQLLINKDPQDIRFIKTFIEFYFDKNKY